VWEEDGAELLKKGTYAKSDEVRRKKTAEVLFREGLGDIEEIKASR